MAAPSSSASAFTSHLLTRLDADLAFLSAQGLLSPPDLALIRSKLAPIHSAPALELGLAALTVGAQQQRTVPPPPPPSAAAQGPAKATCRAVWDYTKSQPDDLGFKTGDVITIEEEVNADWWKGSLHGQTGLFPCNHVERLPASSAPAPPPTAPAPAANGYNASYGGPPQQQHWTPPPPAAVPSYAYAQPQNYGSSSFSEKAPYAAPPPPPQQQYSYTQPPPQQPQQVVVQPPPHTDEKKGKFGKFGKTMGTAVAGGVGFGVGSSLASEAVHAIF
ncbi:hypothetical protein JCM10449v2_007768 [Rhodotorula kratochvilovae]